MIDRKGEPNWTSCRRCGADTITLYHWMTNSNIEVDLLPAADGNIEVDFQTGKCQVIAQQHLKKHRPPLWRAHVASCAAL